MTAHRYELADQSPTRHAWREDAACRGEPPERFTEPANTDDLRQALATCASCPVRQPCLQTALTLERQADLGIWGGTTETTRRRIRDGQLSVGHVLNRRDRSRGDRASSNDTVEPISRANAGPRARSASHGIAGTTALEDSPMLTISRDKHGDYTDATGRVIIFRIHGHPPYMLMIDGRCHTRAETLAAARRTAWEALYPSRSRNLLLADEEECVRTGRGHPFGPSRNK